MSLSWLPNKIHVIRAISYKGFWTHEIKSFKETYGLKQGTGQVVQQARADAIDLSHGKKKFN